MMQILIAIDQLLNALCGGYADETLSARMYRNRNKSWFWALLYREVNRMFFLQDNHCFESYLSEIQRKQLPSEYRQKGQ